MSFKSSVSKHCKWSCQHRCNFHLYCVLDQSIITGLAVVIVPPPTPPLLHLCAPPTWPWLTGTEGTVLYLISYSSWVLMWNQTEEADWGSEMDRHSPTRPCLCYQRSIDYMTEGVMEGVGVAGGYKCWCRGIHARQRIAFTPWSPLTEVLFILLLFLQYAKRPVQWCMAPFLLADNTHYSKGLRICYFSSILWQSADFLLITCAVHNVWEVIKVPQCATQCATQASTLGIIGNITYVKCVWFIWLRV